jgi:hypothetical protein
VTGPHWSKRTLKRDEGPPNAVRKAAHRLGTSSGLI